MAALIIFVHLALSIIYSVAVPPWEAHDELQHYRYIDYVATHWSLPGPEDLAASKLGPDESTQPPLYYYLTAPFVALVDRAADQTPTLNPYFSRGTGEGGVNFAVHPNSERFPFHGMLLALHVARAISVLIGTAGLLLTYALAGLLAPGRKLVAVGALAFNALAPQYVFINSVVTNDTLLVVLGTATVYWSLRTAARPVQARRLFVLGIIAGLTLLTKYLALALLPLVFLSIMFAVSHSRKEGRTFRRIVGESLAFGVTLLVVVGWWFRRNWLLHGRIFSRDPLSETSIIEGLQHPLRLMRRLDWSLVPETLRYGFRTFWASFGWGNVEAPDWVYLAFAILCLLGAVGFLVFLAQKRTPGSIKLNGWLTLLAIGLMVALPLFREILHDTTYLRGRHFLDALPAACVILVMGWRQLLPERLQIPVITAINLAIGLLSIIMLWGVILPAYARPALLSSADLLPGERPLHASFDQQVELVAYDIWPDKGVEPDTGLAVTILWRALAPMEENYTFSIQLLGVDGQSYGMRTGYPGSGNFATSLWQPGDLFRETYWIPVHDVADSDLPLMSRVGVAILADLDDHHPHLPVFSPDGGELGEMVFFGRVRLADPQPGQPAAGPAAQFLLGMEAALRGIDLNTEITHRAGGILPITLYWEALSDDLKDYNIFVHLIDSAGQIVTQADGPPRGGRYPTDLWISGEVVTDARALVLPLLMESGQYRLAVGMYQLESLERIPISDAQGQPVPDNQMIVGELSIAGWPHKQFLPTVFSDSPPAGGK